MLLARSLGVRSVAKATAWTLSSPSTTREMTTSALYWTGIWRLPARSPRPITSTPGCRRPPGPSRHVLQCPPGWCASRGRSPEAAGRITRRGEVDAHRQPPRRRRRTGHGRSPLGGRGRRGYQRVSLEAGTTDAFAPAVRSLYTTVGFKPCAPFGEYTVNPYSAYTDYRPRFSGRWSSSDLSGVELLAVRDPLRCVPLTYRS